MLTLHLRKLINSRQHKVISTSITRQFFLPHLNSTNEKFHPLQKISVCAVIPCRHFSFTGFYAAIAESTPVVSLQNVLLDIHQSTGLPWWSVIMFTTLGIRTLIVLPLAVHQNQVIARLANINAEIANLAPELNKEVNIAKGMYKFDEDHAKRVFRKQLRVIYNKCVVRDNCHPFKTILLALFQIPAWICFSISLRNLTLMSIYSNPVPESLKQLKNEGILWFSDLTSPDPIFIPLLLMVANLSLIEVHALRHVGKGSRLQKFLLNFSRIITVVVAAAATINPSSVTFYWLCSSTYGLAQGFLFMSPKFRRIVGIPDTGRESATPFKDIATNFKKRFNK